MNPKAETVEELLGRRKHLHMGMMTLAKQDLALALQAANDDDSLVHPPVPPPPFRSLCPTLCLPWLCSARRTKTRAVARLSSIPMEPARLSLQLTRISAESVLDLCQQRIRASLRSKGGDMYTGLSELASGRRGASCGGRSQDLDSRSNLGVAVGVRRLVPCFEQLALDWPSRHAAATAQRCTLLRQIVCAVFDGDPRSGKLALASRSCTLTNLTLPRLALTCGCVWMQALARARAGEMAVLFGDASEVSL